MARETLDKVLKKKVEPLLEETMHKILGVTISEFGKDISDKIEKFVPMSISLGLLRKASSRACLRSSSLTKGPKSMETSLEG